MPVLPGVSQTRRRPKTSSARIRESGSCTGLTASMATTSSPSWSRSHSRMRSAIAASTSGVKCRRRSHCPSSPDQPVISLIKVTVLIILPLPASGGATAPAAAPAASTKTAAETASSTEVASAPAIKAATETAGYAAAPGSTDGTALATCTEAPADQGEHHGDSAADEANNQTAKG